MRLGVIDFSEKHANIGTLFWATVLCTHAECAWKSSRILCLFFDCKSMDNINTDLLVWHFWDFTSVDIIGCDCATQPQVLVHHGLFPSSPAQPHLAVSVELLGFYRALFERSCDAINSLAAALHTHYVRRGFYVVDKVVHLLASIHY